MIHRNTADPSAAGIAPGWAFACAVEPAHPLQSRLLRRERQSRGTRSASLIEWTGKKWDGFDVPDFPAKMAPGNGAGPFILTEEGQGRLWCRALMRDGPFPAYYEPFESPVKNLLAPKIQGNPVSRVFPDDWKRFGTAEEFPYAATTYRLTEHFHYWTKHAEDQRDPAAGNSSSRSVRSSRPKRASPRAIGCASGRSAARSRPRPSSPSASSRCCATARRSTWSASRSTGASSAPRWRVTAPNTLTPFVGDANTNTPEFKAFLVNVERTDAPEYKVS